MQDDIGFAHLARGEGSLAYLLKPGTAFSLTSYKVLQGQQDAGFLRCVHVLHNGQHKLVYGTGGLATLAGLLPGLPPEGFAAVARSMLDTFLHMRDVGFLQLASVELADELVFVCLPEYTVRLVYIPVELAGQDRPLSTGLGGIKAYLSGIFERFPAFHTPLTANFYSALADPASTLEQLRNSIPTRLAVASRPKGGRAAPAQQPLPHRRPATQEAPTPSPPAPSGQEPGAPQDLAQGAQPLEMPAPGQKAPAQGQSVPPPPPEDSPNGPQGEGPAPVPAPVGSQNLVDTQVLADIFVPKLVLEGLHMAEGIEVLISKREFVLGKKEGSVDGVVDCSSAVSRVHCRVSTEEDQIYIEDLGSANGTYVNGRRVQPGEKAPIRGGDRVKLANVLFAVNQL